jgi:hypothetical protein
VRLNTAVGETAPNSYEERCDDDRTYQWDAPQERFTCNMKVEDPHQQKNGEESDNNCTYDAIGRTPTSEQFTHHTNYCGNYDPNEHLHE